MHLIPEVMKFRQLFFCLFDWSQGSAGRDAFCRLPSCFDQIQSGEGVDISYSRHTETGTPYLPNQLLEAYPDLKDRDIYLCGPEPFKNAVLEYLASLEYDMNKLEVEHFVRIDNGVQQTKRRYHAGPSREGIGPSPIPIPIRAIIKPRSSLGRRLRAPKKQPKHS